MNKKDIIKLINKRKNAREKLRTAAFMSGWLSAAAKHLEVIKELNSILEELKEL